MNEVFRQEKKYLLSLDQYYKLSHYLSQFLVEDKHNQGEGYHIRSLYFDTIDDKDFDDKVSGVELRRKIRLRTYRAEQQSAALEMKQKQGELQKKRSLIVSKEDAREIIKRNYSVLLKYEDDFAVECYSLMNSMCYLPKTVVDYQRRAFVADGNNIRITFDHHMRGTESNFDIFDEKLVEYPVWDPYVVVLEVKFNGFLLSYIKDALRDCGVGETSFSKYCLARAVSTHYRY